MTTMENAKALMTQAAVASVRGWPWAEQMAGLALAELDAARRRSTGEKRSGSASAQERALTAPTEQPTAATISDEPANDPEAAT